METNIQLRADLRLCIVHGREAARGFHSSWHAHSFHELGLVFEGSCTWKFRNRAARTVRAGEMILIPPFCDHREEAGGLVRLGWAGFVPLGSDGELRSRSIRQTAEPCEEALFLLEHLYREQERTGRSQISAITLHHILLLFSRAEKRRRPAVDKSSRGLNPRQIQVVQSVANYLERNEGRRLSMEQVANYHQLSAHHLNILFQKCYGMTPTRYRMRQRINAAQVLLEAGALSIKEIASAGGFTDVAHFTREFKRRTGRTPGDARNFAGAASSTGQAR